MALIVGVVSNAVILNSDETIDQARIDEVGANDCQRPRLMRDVSDGDSALTLN
ncbi:hypothetical protein ACSFA2_00005 [Variovorax sp. LT2P21]|uniref:hypothetical protein n=1 Tax=Variovorax sp. LT2P21 TaxID=3443731 RepID=UPI003F484476